MKMLDVTLHHRYSFHHETGGAYYLKDDITAEVDGAYIVYVDEDVIKPMVFNTEFEVMIHLLKQQGIDVKITHTV